MKTFRIRAVALIFIYILIMISSLTVNADSEMNVEAKAALLMDVDSGKVLYSLNASDKLYPASLTKIMTALLALENGKLSDVLTVAESALTDKTTDGSPADLLAGEQLTLEDLLYCALVSSDNDSCNVIAQYVSGSIDEFVKLMNKRAAELGCTNTNFANANGLQNENHYTTAEDMAKITMQAMTHPDFLKICNTATKEIPATNLSAARYLYTTNYLISDLKIQGYTYQYARGIKTGHTSPAGMCLVSTAEKNGITLLSVVMGAESAEREDGTVDLKSFSETTRLFKWGFENFSVVTVLSSSDPTTEVPVSLAANVDVVVLHPSESITSILPDDYNQDNLKTEVEVFNKDKLEAPITKGAILGKITVSYDGEEIGSTDLIALTDIYRSEVLFSKQRIKELMSKLWFKLIATIVFLVVAAYVTFIIVLNVNKNKRKKDLGSTYKGSSRIKK